MNWTIEQLVEHFPNHEKKSLEKILDLQAERMNPEELPGVQNWVKQCFHPPRKPELLMAAYNEVLEYHGLEAIHEGPDATAYQPQAVYCNSGDSYHPTILYEPRSNLYQLTSWGDYVENLENTTDPEEDT